MCHGHTTEELAWLALWTTWVLVHPQFALFPGMIKETSWASSPDWRRLIDFKLR